LHINGLRANKFFMAYKYKDYTWIENYLAISLSEDDFVKLGFERHELTDASVIPHFLDEAAVRKMHQDSIDNLSGIKINGKSWKQLNPYEKHRIAEQIYLAIKDN